MKVLWKIKCPKCGKEFMAQTHVIDKKIVR